VASCMGKGSISSTLIQAVSAVPARALPTQLDTCRYDLFPCQSLNTILPTSPARGPSSGLLFFEGLQLQSGKLWSERNTRTDHHHQHAEIVNMPKTGLASYYVLIKNFHIQMLHGRSKVSFRSKGSCQGGYLGCPNSCSSHRFSRLLM
jgi:hypothetical protein